MARGVYYLKFIQWDPEAGLGIRNPDPLRAQVWHLSGIFHNHIKGRGNAGTYTTFTKMEVYVVKLLVSLDPS